MLETDYYKRIKKIENETTHIFEKLLSKKDNMRFADDELENQIKKHEFFEWVEMIAEFSISYEDDEKVLKILKMKYQEMEYDITAIVWVYKILFEITEYLKSIEAVEGFKLLKKIERIIKI